MVFFFQLNIRHRPRVFQSLAVRKRLSELVRLDHFLQILVLQKKIDLGGQY